MQDVLIEGDVVENEFARVAGDELMAVSRHRVIESHDGIRNQRAGWVADRTTDRAVLDLRLRGDSKRAQDCDQQEKSKHGCSHS